MFVFDCYTSGAATTAKEQDHISLYADKSDTDTGDGINMRNREREGVLQQGVWSCYTVIWARTREVVIYRNDMG